MEAGAPPKMTDTDFLFTDEFKNLSIDLQHELINEAMRELGENPAHAGVGKLISLN